jgi:hypothetical protein
LVLTDYFDALPYRDIDEVEMEDWGIAGLSVEEYRRKQRKGN